MAGALIPLTTSAPGYSGLNTEVQAIGIGMEWASIADNVVFDEAGRMVPRKGMNVLTSSALGGTPSVDVVFEYEIDASNVKVISATNNKLYHGTTTLTEITGSLTVTDNDWQFQNFAGSVVGWQDGHEPIYWTNTGNFATIQSQHTDWATGTAYNIGDTVKATSASHPTYYWVCIVAGTSHATTEPTWVASDGNQITDNTVTWEAVLIPQGNMAHSAFGRLWAMHSDGTTLKYSGLLNNKVYDINNGGGTIDLSNIWAGGSDYATAIYSHNNYIIIFGQHSILVYNTPYSPLGMALEDNIHGIGCIARDSVQSIGTDLVFLSGDGLRSLARTVTQENMPLTDLSRNVRGDFLNTVDNTTDKTVIKSVYNRRDGQYIIKMNTFAWCFDIKRMQDGIPRITRWPTYPAYSLCRGRDDTVYLGGDGVVADYSGYLDDTSTYNMTYRSVWLDLRSVQPELINTFKVLKQLSTIIVGGSGLSITYKWGVDFEEDKYSSKAFTIAGTINDVIAEWGVGEWGISEWGGGSSSIADQHVNMKGHGQYFKFGFDVSINNQELAVQATNILLKQGRRIN